MKETITRSLTGIVFVALIILSLVLHPLAYLFLFSIACTAAWFELARLFPERLSSAMKIPVAVLITGSYILVFFIAGGPLSPKWLLLPPAALVLVLVRVWMPARTGSVKNIPLITAAVIYIFAGFSIMHFLAFPIGAAGYTPRWILFTFFFLWTNDSMAYVSGRLAGKHPVWPSVSPGKTWEGSFGGAVFTLALAMVFSHFYPELSAWEWAGFAAIVIFFGSLGDFFESWLKRKAGVKDSGKLLPGHGGILDRFDSMLLSIPFVTIYSNFVL